jgi:hypothetical protein
MPAKPKIAPPASVRRELGKKTAASSTPWSHACPAAAMMCKVEEPWALQGMHGIATNKGSFREPQHVPVRTAYVPKKMKTPGVLCSSTHVSKSPTFSSRFPMVSPRIIPVKSTTMRAIFEMATYDMHKQLHRPGVSEVPCRDMFLIPGGSLK